MSFDAHKNLAIATVTTATGAAGTTLGVGAGEGARFPAVPFNATVWPVDMAPDPTTAEVVRVTARTGDSLTITRAQEGTTARAIIVGDFVAATITAKSLTDIESGVNFPLLTTPGAVTAPTHASAAATPLVLAPAGTERGRLHVSGGFSWGGTTDPGAGNFSVAGGLSSGITTGAYLTVNGPGGGSRFQTLTNSDGTVYHGMDSSTGGNFGYTGSAAVTYCTTPGGIMFTCTHAAAPIRFQAGGAIRGVMHPSGGFSWGGTTDPGANAFCVGANPVVAGQAGVWMHITGTMAIGAPGTAQAYVITFNNANGRVGQIETAGSVTTYSTSSDARLKTPLSRHSDTDVLRNTVIHDFLWKSDGTVGRGVFAQEAHLVAPFAVSVGTDDVDDQGRLTKPWGVDYSKYVPDLIAGWQYHDTRMTAFFHDHLLAAERITALEKRLSIPQPSLMNRLESLGRLVTYSIITAWNAWKPSWV